MLLSPAVPLVVGLVGEPLIENGVSTFDIISGTTVNVQPENVLLSAPFQRWHASPVLAAELVATTFRLLNTMLSAPFSTRVLGAAAVPRKVSVVVWPVITAPAANAGVGAAFTT